MELDVGKAIYGAGAFWNSSLERLLKKSLPGEEEIGVGLSKLANTAVIARPSRKPKFPNIDIRRGGLLERAVA